jgi:hypothetical protein
VWPEASLGVVVVTLVERRVGLDGLQLHRVERDLVGRRNRRSCDDGNVFDSFRMVDGPLENVHSAHRTADDGVPLRDADYVAELFLSEHLIANGEIRKA